MNDVISNTPELSVSELSGALKRTVEDAFGHVRLRGEISGYRGPHGSGHVYFSLKDANAKIDAVIWKGVFSRIKFRPEDGLEVIATGKITTFPGKSSYQIIIDSMEPAGVGALMALLEERRRKLGAEGLFDAARKQLLPYLPEVIGVITSPTGAVIRDVLHRIADRFPRHVIVWPVKVQGEGSAGEVAAAIRGFNALAIGGSIPRPDVLIVARGGGSLEDLWGFNEEIVVRAAAESDIPLIAAVGHETDWTLIDHAADIRAPTPTAAAEMAVPVRAELNAALADRAARLAGASLRLQMHRRRDLANLVRALPDAESLFAEPRQRLDLAILKRNNAIAARQGQRRLALSTFARRLGAQSPEARLARFRATLAGISARLPGIAGRMIVSRADRLREVDRRRQQAFTMRLGLAARDAARHRGEIVSAGQRLARAWSARMDREARRLAGLGQMLNSLGYEQVLARGFAVVRDAGGVPVRSAATMVAGGAISIQFADGRADAVATSGSSSAPPKPAPRAAKPTSGGGGQGSLF